MHGQLRRFVLNLGHVVAGFGCGMLVVILTGEIPTYPQALSLLALGVSSILVGRE